jgi:scavenger receptor class B, member 1
MESNQLTFLQFSLTGVFFLLTTGLILISIGISVILFQPYDFIFKWVSFFILVVLNVTFYEKRMNWYVTTIAKLYVKLQKLLFSDDGEIFQLWERPPVDLYLKVYLFNITNAEEFMAGRDKKLNVEEIGPYVYR